MNAAELENLLDQTVAALTEDIRSSERYHGPEAFQQGVLDTLKDVAKNNGVLVEPTFHPDAFPDIRANGFGIEVKYTRRDRWQAVGNSIFEGMRDPDVEDVYVVFGKMSGVREARWRKYQDCVTRVSVAHAPRFVIDMEGESESLFSRMGVEYNDFAKLDDARKMRHVRDYSRGRLKRGERLWWIEQEHFVPIEVRTYMSLTQAEKRMLRSEAALLCPQVCGGPRARNKYVDASLYLLIHHGVFCPQARDLFSAGSVAHKRDSTRGGNYVQRALQDIQDLMKDAAEYLDDDLFEEYWGASCPPDERISEWLRRADGYASGWIPSETLFLD